MNVLDELAVQLQGICLEKGLSVAVAESCTGGMVASALVGVPGSSGYFQGGVVSYSNLAKREILGVSELSLAGHGAVSEQVAIQMASGARILFHTDVAISVTGVAGPGGGTPDKPVGLTFIGISSSINERAYEYHWTGNRKSNRTSSAQEAIRLLIEWAESKN